jgi:hypothetical protein
MGVSSYQKRSDLENGPLLPVKNGADRQAGNDKELPTTTVGFESRSQAHAQVPEPTSAADKLVSSWRSSMPHSRQAGSYLPV